MSATTEVSRQAIDEEILQIERKPRSDVFSRTREAGLALRNRLEQIERAFIEDTLEEAEEAQKWRQIFLGYITQRLTSESNGWESPLKPQHSTRPKPSTDSSTKEQEADEERATVEQHQSDKNPLAVIGFLRFHFLRNTGCFRWVVVAEPDDSDPRLHPLLLRIWSRDTENWGKRAASFSGIFSE